MGTEKIWISDVVGDDYKNWLPGEWIGFDAGTGTGKTTFIFKTLAACRENGEQILYLCNRVDLREQTETTVKAEGLAGTIIIRSYQKLEDQIRASKNNAMDFVKRFRYVFADECHYFFADSHMNPYTELSWNLLRSNNTSTIIWASATARTFFDLPVDAGKIAKNHIYRVEKDYSYVDGLVFYRKDQLRPLINKILAEEEDSKILVFVNSEKRMRELHSFYEGQADFYCSQNNNPLKQICSPDAVKDCSFEHRILFATSAMDNGIDIKDKRVRHIFSELVDIDSLAQSLGRKRNDPDDETDRCTFYVREWNGQEINCFNNINAAKLGEAVMYEKDRERFWRFHEHDRNVFKNNPIFFVTKDGDSEKVRINRVALFKAQMNEAMYSAMKSNGYINTVKDYLGDYFSDKLVISDIQPSGDLLIEYLHGIEGKKLYKPEITDLKEKFRTAMTIRKKPTRHLGIHTLNGWLEDNYSGKNRYPLRLKSYKDNCRVLPDGSVNQKRGEHYWVLE